MKKSLFLSILILAALVFCLSACGSPAAGSALADSAADVSELVIGVNDGSQGVFRVELTNKTGKAITEFSIKESSEEKFPENMLPAGQTFAADEMRVLYFAPKEAAGTDAGQTESGKLLEPIYEAGISFEDGSRLEWKAIPFGDMEKAELCLEGDTIFVEYTSVTTGESINTLEAAKQSEQLAAEEPAPENTEKEPENTPASNDKNTSSNKTTSGNNSKTENSGTSDNGCIGNDGLVYDGNDGGGSTDNSSGGGDEGCIGDEGLTW